MMAPWADGHYRALGHRYGLQRDSVGGTKAYGAGDARRIRGGPEMTLQEAIEEVKRSPMNWMTGDICWQVGRRAQAIATILNAVVKGELK